MEKRDPKGLYKKARAGEIRGAEIGNYVHGAQTNKILFFGYSEFTGISAPYEPPLNAELHIKTAECDVKEAVQIITGYLLDKGYITGVHK